MRLVEFTREINDYDRILFQLCKLLIEEFEKNPEKEAGVAACILDNNGNRVLRTSFKDRDKFIHAERAAIKAYEDQYGTIGKDCVCITTLSPCSNPLPDRVGPSCDDLLREKGIKNIYAGYKDPTHNNDNFAVTKNQKIKDICKMFADTFLKENLNQCNNMRLVEFTKLEPQEQNFLAAMHDFLPLVMQELGLTTLPKIKPQLRLGTDDQPSFGRYANEENAVYLAIENRHIIDILRTLAHELVHYKQDLQGQLAHDSGETGSDEENQANSQAGVVMRNFNKKFPKYFSTTPIGSNS